MIKRLQIQNFKALRDVTMELTPIHVLIGPNDSGKTSILEAVAALCRSVDHELNHAFTGSWDGRKLVWRETPGLSVSLTATLEHQQQLFEYLLSTTFSPTGRSAAPKEEMVRFNSSQQDLAYRAAFEGFSSGGDGPSGYAYSTGVRNVLTDDLTPIRPGRADKEKAAQLIHESLSGVHYYRLVPRFLGLPAAPDSKRRFRMEPSGFGLVLCLDDILGFDRNRFAAMESRFRQIFPQLKSIKLIPEPAFRSPTDDPEQIPMLERADGKGLYFEFVGADNLVSASQVSDGMLLVLAYLSVLHLPQPPRVVLVDEPENGIHPKRLQDVIKILRDLVKEQSHTQAILTTHSPYLVDLFRPEEVTLCRRLEDGSVSVRRLSESQSVRDQLDVFTLGEIWTAEGDEALVQTPTEAGSMP